MTKVKCQTPEEFCSGSLEPMNASFSRGANKAAKLHLTHEDALKCYSRHLVRQLGFRRVSSREFDPQNGGPHTILTKPCRYGSKMRRGKEGNRFMPKFQRKNTRAGCVIG